MATKKKKAVAAYTTATSETTAPEVVETPVVETVEATKMDPRIKKLWVADLRSGKYKQIAGDYTEDEKKQAEEEKIHADARKWYESLPPRYKGYVDALMESSRPRA